MIFIKEYVKAILLTVIFFSGYRSFANWSLAKIELPMERGICGNARIKKPVAISSHFGIWKFGISIFTEENNVVGFSIWKNNAYSIPNPIINKAGGYFLFPRSTNAIVKATITNPYSMTPDPSTM